MNALIHFALLAFSFTNQADLDRSAGFSAERWSYSSIFMRSAQRDAHVAGVAGVGEAASAYLAVLCTKDHGFEMRASMGRYIGVPRDSRPLVFSFAGGELALSPEVRADYFVWNGDAAEQLLETLSRQSVVKARFSLWDRSTHTVEFSLEGSTLAIDAIRGKCR